MKRFLATFSLRRDNPTLLKAQFDALTSRVPILYILLIINAVAVSITHIGTAPLWLAAHVPVAMSFVCIFRLLWWKMQRKNAVTAEEAYVYLRRTLVLASLLTFGYGFWAVGLYQYGDAYQRGQIAYFLVVAGISCVFCLMHLPAAALVTTAITFTLMVITFMFSGNLVFVATAVSVIFLSFAFVRVISSYFENFAGLVYLTEELEKKQGETEQLNRINSHNALCDQLTGLSNRRRFFQLLECMLKQDPDHPPIVGLVDLDGFKPVNDVFGHAAGDAVLKETAERFQALIVEGGIVARLGGDEFGIILPHGPSREDVNNLGLAFCHALREPFEIHGGSVKLSGSCGIAYPEGRESVAEEIYEQADFALYQVKSKRTGSVEFFSLAHEEMLRRRHTIEFALQASDLDSELSLEYQPVIDLMDHTVVGFEALARWNNPRLGNVSPSDFIPAAERIGTIGKMTRVLLGQALSALAVIPPHLRMSFNLSARDICDHATSMTLLAMIHRAGVDPRRLEFEITETALLSDFDTAADVIRLFRANGISISLDDFGTGFSSLSHVHRLEFDKIKIDKSFVLKADTDIRCMNIIRSVGNLCENLGIQSVAEGIENDEIAEELRAMGVTLGQGYVFSRPLKLAAAIDYANSHAKPATLKAISAAG